MNKKILGQFFTTNSEYILDGFQDYIKNKNITDPFCGNKDLLNWAIKNNAKSVIGYDIDKKYIDNKVTFLNDSLKNPLKYDFVLTNPPYLYKNKIKDNFIFTDTKNTDLYQISLEKIMNSQEGIVIVPINFLSAENSKYIRNKFFNKFDIIYCKLFTQQVFNDTTYSVIVFYFKIKEKPNFKQIFTLNIQPENIYKQITIYEKYNWQIGGEFLYLINNQNNKLNIKRLINKDIKDGNFKIRIARNHLKNIEEINIDEKNYKLIKNNIIFLKAIDTGSKNGLICLDDIRKYNIDCLLSVESSRNQIYLIFQNQISIEEQENIIKLFNYELDKQREEYFSLFMTNYRDNNRKRISFDFCYKMINYIYFDIIKGIKTNEREYSLF